VSCPEYSEQSTPSYHHAYRLHVQQMIQILRKLCYDKMTSNKKCICTAAALIENDFNLGRNSKRFSSFLILDQVILCQTL
jgi:hypothetical protein